MSSSIVIIGPADSIPALRERLDSGAELHTFTDAEALEALDHIFRHRPRIIAIEHDFSSSSRGVALVNRIKDDPGLATCEVRVITHDSGINRMSSRRRVSNTAVAVAEPPVHLDRRGTRRSQRTRVGDGLEVLVDGNPTMLIDVSVVGAQVMSTSVLKPNQRVRMALSDARGVIRCHGAIVWASFEMPKGLPTHYRAGIEFQNADAEALSEYAERHRRKS
ncbi:MAG: hypothetical protein ABR606_01285 [Vicinamibacterales bacterium]